MADIGRFLRDFAIGATPTSDYFARKKAFEGELQYGERQHERGMRDMLTGQMVSGLMLPEAMAQRNMQRAVSLENIRDAINRGFETFKTEEGVRGAKLMSPVQLEHERESITQKLESEGGGWGVPTYPMETRRKYADAYETASKRPTGGGFTAEDMVDLETKSWKLLHLTTNLSPTSQAIFNRLTKAKDDRKFMTNMAYLFKEGKLPPEEKGPMKDVDEAIRLTAKLRVRDLFEYSKKGQELDPEIADILGKMKIPEGEMPKDKDGNIIGSQYQTAYEMLFNRDLTANPDMWQTVMVFNMLPEYMQLEIMSLMTPEEETAFKSTSDQLNQIQRQMQQQAGEESPPAIK